MTFRKFHECLCRVCSSVAFADNIVGDIMDDIECWDWDALIPDKYIKIHLGNIA